MSINDKLQTFLTEEVEPVYEKKKIEKENNDVRERVRKKLGDDIVSDFLMGSYIRNTLTKRIKKDDKYDVDVMIVYDDEKYSEYKLEDLLKKTYSVCGEIKEAKSEIIKVKKQRVSVGLIYEDNFKIDIVPAIESDDENLYIIYDRRNWEAVKTNPKKHNKILSDLNKKRDMKLVPLIKLIKRWKEENCIKFFKSFHLELLAVDIFKEKDISGYAEGMNTFFEEAVDLTKDKKEINDPVNDENDVSSYLDEEKIRDSAVGYLEQGLTDISEAIDCKDDEEGQDRALGRMFEYFQSDKDKEKSKLISSTYKSTREPAPWVEKT